ncbi:hypothetical protein XENOCAPTIV_023989, partial [Xenoophorus captivus]
MDRTNSGPQQSQSSVKKPSFNLSVFGNSSNAPVRRLIKAKPAGAQPCGVTSATARRILQSLERMSSPLAVSIHRYFKLRFRFDPPKVSSTSPCAPFTFSSPIVKATAASPPSYSPSVLLLLSFKIPLAPTPLPNRHLLNPLPVLQLAQAPPLRFLRRQGTWDCDTCLVSNKPDAVKCVACETAKPGTGLKPSLTFPPVFSAAKTASTSSDPVFTGISGFGDKFKKPEGAWECETCLVQNKAEDTKCVACMAAKPESSSKDTSAASGFKFGGSSEGFKFGGASNDDKKSELPATGAGFKFGGSSEVAFGSGSSSTESNSSAKDGFTFGLPKPAEKTPETTTSSSSVTLTPLSSSQENGNKAVSSNDTTSTNTNPTTTATSKGSVFGRLGEPGLASSTPQVSSTFGSLQAGKEPAAQAFAFGKPEEKKEADPSPAPLTFVFGATKKEPDPAPASSGGFSFSKPSAPTEQPPPAFTFGKPAEKSETSTSETSKPTFSFGQSAAGTNM